jgi:hypothetical protein
MRCNIPGGAKPARSAAVASLASSLLVFRKHFADIREVLARDERMASRLLIKKVIFETRGNV